MITHIHIKNFAIVRELSIDADSGFTVLTGETGAGKSLWVGAASLVLGERADSSVILPGESRCEITLSFDINAIPAAQAWLTEHEFATETQDCILRRIITLDGRSRSTINGHPCPQHLMKQLSQYLVAIHSQHQHQALLNPEHQRDVLDHYAGLYPLRTSLQSHYRDWQTLEEKIVILQKKSEQREQQLDWLKYQLEEFDALELQPEKWEALSTQHKKMHHAQALKEKLHTAQALLAGGSSMGTHCSALLQQALHALQQIQAYSANIAPTIEMLESAQIHLSEAHNDISHELDQLDADEAELEQLEKEFTKVMDLARKHHCKPETLLEKYQTLQQEYVTLTDIDVQLAALKKQQTAILTAYKKIAQQLHDSRQQAATQLSQFITEKMHKLGMPAGECQLQVEMTYESPTPHGLDKVNLLVKTNPGHPLQALSKIVSGGELSRISLAIQVITASKENTPTLIFDEVDVGIGGKTAAIVGQLLKQLGEHAQVICITHQPQVAAEAHHHYRVEKVLTEKDTNTTITILSKEERVQELARMLGGEKITQQTLAHAEEMLAG